MQRQGLDRIDVQLPGIQNSAEVKNLLGQVATLEFRLNDTTANPVQAAQTGNVPLGDKLYYAHQCRPAAAAEARGDRHRR